MTKKTAVLPPQNTEAEEAVIGSLLIDPQSYTAVSDVLAAADFYLATHRWIYEAITALDARRSPLDYLTLTTELENQGRLKAVGGGAYISTLINAVPSAINVVAYAQMIADAARRRDLLQAASDIARSAHDESRAIDVVLDDAEAAVFKVCAVKMRDGPVRLAATAESYYDDLTGTQPFLLSTGYPSLDSAMGGFRPGSVHVIASRPGVGKSVLLTNFADKMARDKGKNVLFFTLEMSREEVLGRILCAHGAISAADLRAGRVPEQRTPDLIDGIGKIADVPLWIDPTAGITVQAIRSKSRRMAAEVGLDVLVIDYVQLIRTTEKGQMTRQQYIGAIMRDLKRLARELHVPILLAAQLGRGADNRKPLLGDLRECGDIEQDSDMVMFLWPLQAVESERFRPTLVFALKYRQGNLFAITLGLDLWSVAFVPLSEERESPGSRW